MAAATASPLWGAVVMATFGLATIPALFFLGSVTKFLQKGSLRGSMMKLAALLVVAYGIFTMYKGYNFVAHPNEMQEMMDSMRETPKDGKCGGMKCAPGKCG
jgi:sulfite exporter TauE/SafE